MALCRLSGRKKGAAVWYLGQQFGGIAERAHRLILPMRDYAVNHYFIIDPGIGRIDVNYSGPIRRRCWESNRLACQRLSLLLLQTMP